MSSLIDEDDNASSIQSLYTVIKQQIESNHVLMFKCSSLERDSTNQPTSSLCQHPSAYYHCFHHYQHWSHDHFADVILWKHHYHHYHHYHHWSNHHFNDNFADILLRKHNHHHHHHCYHPYHYWSNHHPNDYHVADILLRKQPPAVTASFYER